MRNKKQNLYFRLLVLLFFSLCGNYYVVVAQNNYITVRGSVVDQEKRAVIGANVVVEGSVIGTTVDLDGNFFLSVPSRKSVLEVSFLGYKTEKILVGSKTTIKVTLAVESEVLQDVVVIAYGSQSKATVTGALSSVGSEDLNKTPVSSVVNILSGKVPGVSTIQTSGQPGNDAAQIFVRGAGSISSAASQPLILVDGVERSIASVDPNEIESLSVLKDASSTAVFGVRGANGVIIVTTKRGRIGKPTISVSSITGVQQPISYLEQTGSYEYAKMWNQRQANDGITDQTKYFSREAIEAYRTGGDPVIYSNTDWADKMFNKLFLQTTNSINISGGSEEVQYFVSVGTFYQNGILQQIEGLDYDNNYEYNRYNFRTNLDFKLSRTTKMKFNIGGNVGKSQEPRVKNDMKEAWNAVSVWSVPMAGPGIIDGTRTIIDKSMLPGVVARDGYDVFYGYGYNQSYKTTLNMDVELTQDLAIITKGLTISAKGSLDNRFNLNKYRKGNGAESQFVSYKSHLDAGAKLPITDPMYDKTHVFRPDGIESSPLVYSEDYAKDRSWYMEMSLNYKRTINNDHSVSALLLYNQSRDYYPSIPKAYAYIPRGYVGLVGRVTYGYKYKYLADFSVGYNGSENFAPGVTRYGLFPSMSLGYVVSKEDFMQSVQWIDNLKFRASAGKVGNDKGINSRFMYIDGAWVPANNIKPSKDFDYSFGVNNPNGLEYYYSGIPGNKEVTWETAVKYNFGADLLLFNNRLSFSADYFIENRTDILLQSQSIPSIIATVLPNLNIGEVENRGYEIAVGWSDVIGNDFRYAVDANMSYAKNKIIYMDEIRSNNAYQNQTGGSTGRQTDLYKFEGIYGYNDFTEQPDGTLVLNPNLPQPSSAVYPGDARYADLNEDKIIDGNDKGVSGYSDRPEYMFGVNTKFDYKGFSLSMQWTGATNVDKVLGLDYRVPFTNAGSRGLLDYFYTDTWSPINQGGALPRASNISSSWNSQPSTLWLRDASYIRLKSLNFGYTFQDSKLLRNIGVTNLTVMFTGYNLLTFSSLKIMDPEAVANNDGLYPLVKTYNLGINVNF